MKDNTIGKLGGRAFYFVCSFLMICALVPAPARTGALQSCASDEIGEITQIAMADDGSVMAIGDYQRQVYLYDVTTCAIVWSYVLDYGNIVNVDMSSDGQYMVAATDDDTDSEGCQIAFFSHLRDGSSGWSNGDGSPVWTADYDGDPGNDFYDVAITPDGQYACGGGSGIPVTLYDQSGTQVQSYSTGCGCLGVSADAQYIAIGNSGGVEYYSSSGSDPIWIHPTDAPVRAIDVSADGQLIVAGTEGGELLAIDAATYSGSPMWSLEFPSMIVGVEISDDGSIIVAGTYDDRVTVLDENGDIEWEHPVPVSMAWYASRTNSVAISGNGERITAAGVNGEVYLFNRDGGRFGSIFVGDGNPANHISVATASSAGIFAAGVNRSGSETLYIFDETNIVQEDYYFVHMTDLHVSEGSNHDRWCDALDCIRDWDPPPDFVVCTGDLVDWGAGETGANNFSLLKSCLSERNGTHYIDADESIPVYFCPGNHDSRPISHTPPYSFENYHDSVGPDYYHSRHRSCGLFSLNTGNDDEFSFIGDLWLPEGDGLYADNVTEYINDLDMLDGIDNATDASSYVKITMGHHPYHTGAELDGVFLNERSSFISACDDYEVDVYLCGHTHDQESIPQPGGHDTRFVITPALVDSNAYRRIFVYPAGDSIVIGGVEYFYECGDADANGSVNISDAIYIINYVFKGGPPPEPEAAGDVNLDDQVNVADAVYLINYIFKGGPPPCA